MKIKENGKEIPIRDSITKIIPQGDSNPISISTNKDNENEKSINLSFNNSYLFDNILSDTLNIEKNNEKISINTKDNGGATYTGGNGIEITPENEINITTSKFLRDISLDGEFVEWGGTSFVKVDLTSNAKNMLRTTGIDIYKTTSEYSWRTNEYITLCNNNINETLKNKKMTVLQYNTTYFFPFTIKSDMVIGGSLTYLGGKVSTLFVVCVKDKDMIFYKTQGEYTKFDPDNLL